MIETLKTYINNKDTEKIISLLIKYPELLNEKDNNENTGLMMIAYSGFEKVFEQAIKLKNSFSFHEAIICGKFEMLKKHLNNSSTNLVNSFSSDGFSPISLAAFFNQNEIAKLLLKKGADPNLCSNNPLQVNALHAAIAKENYELCELFISSGVNVDAVQMQNVTALHSAVHRGNIDLVKLLVENRASIDLRMENGDTAIIIAKKEGHKEIERYLLNQRV